MDADLEAKVEALLTETAVQDILTLDQCPTCLALYEVGQPHICEPYDLERVRRERGSDERATS